MTHIPNEIWSIIFQYYHSVEGIQVSFQDMIWAADLCKPEVQGLYPTRVCTNWRRIFLANVLTVHLHCGDVDRPLWPEELEILAGVLNLTQSSIFALDIRFGQTRFDEEDRAEFTMQLSALLLPSFQRISRLSVQHLRELLNQPTGVFCALQFLSLIQEAPEEFVWEEDDTPSLVSVDLTHSALSLCTLHFQGDVTVPLFQLEWSGIRHLVFEDCTARCILSVVARCTALDSLEFNGCGYIEDATSYELKNLPTVRKFTINEGDYGDDTEFMYQLQSYFVLPSLVQCHIHYWHNDPTPFLFHHPQLLLTHLTLTCARYPELDCLQTIFRNCPHVESVVFKADPGYSWKDNTIGECTEVLNLFRWPSLTRLRLLDLSFNGPVFDQAVFVEVVQSRWDAGKSIEQVRLKIRDLEFGEKAWKIMKQMKVEGLMVHVMDASGKAII